MIPVVLSPATVISTAKPEFGAYYRVTGTGKLVYPRSIEAISPTVIDARYLGATSTIVFGGGSY